MPCNILVLTRWNSSTVKNTQTCVAERHGPLDNSITPACAIERFYYFATLPLSIWCHSKYPNARHISLVYVGWRILRGRRRGGKMWLQCIIIYTIICLKSVVVRKLQVAILTRSPREMYQTDRIVWTHILSRVRVSVRPRIFVSYAKKPKPIVNTESPACCLFQWFADRPLSRQRRKRCAQPWRTDWAHRYSEQRR